MYEWSDLKFFLAAARSGSTLGAARELGVNQTTVARRIAALEEALKVRLFDRHQDGYRLSEAGTAILAQAVRVGEEADTLARLVAQHNRSLSGVIRVTTPEAIANFALTRWLAEFMDLYPDIRIEVIATDQRLDIARGDADIALRSGVLPTEAGIVVRKLAATPWSIYCSQAYAEKRGCPAGPSDLNDHILIGADGWLATLAPFTWLAETAPRAGMRSVCSTIINMVHAIKAGHGVAPLPCAIGAPEAELIECFTLSELKYFYHLVTREGVKDEPRVKAFNDFLVARFQAERELFEGRPRPAKN